MPRGVYVRTEEIREKLRKANLGKYISLETRKKMSKSRKGEKNPFYGKHHSEETRKKIGDKHKGKHLSQKTRKKIGESRKGKKRLPFSEEHKKNIGKTIKRLFKEGKLKSWNKGKRCPKISKKLKGKHFSEEHKKNLSKSHKGKTLTKEQKIKIGKKSKERWKRPGLKENMSKRMSGENNYWYGKHISEEHKRKVGEANKGKIPSEETRRKISIAGKGRIVSEETRKKIQKHRLHQIIPFKDTSIEIKMQNALKERNIVFEKHKPIIGQPDIFIQPNICIFCDGDFWHANPSIYKADTIISRSRTAKDVWERDKRVKEKLEKQGFKVIRFWEHQIHNNINDCIEEINPTLMEMGVLLH